MRNFISILRRFKMSSTLNIIGLSISFAAFTLIMMQVYHEYTFGRSDKDYDRIFLVEQLDDAEHTWSKNNLKQIGEAFVESTPEVEASVPLLFTSSTATIDRNGEKVYHNNENLIRLFGDISQVFDYEMISGTFSSVLNAGNAVISREQARRMFGDDDPMGQRINIMGGDYTVSGVYADLPQNSIVRNAVCVYQDNRQDMRVQSLFVKLRDPRKVDEVTARFAAQNRELPFGYNPSRDKMRLQPIADCYFETDGDVNIYFLGGNRATTDLLLVISILVVVIAAINFVNFATAMAPLRIRGLNTRLVFGSTISALRRALIFEGFAIALISYLVSLLIVVVFNSTNLGGLLKVHSTAIVDNMTAVIGCGAIAVIVGLVAGVYPAYYCTRFTPAVVLKGGTGHTVGGRWLRSTLIGFQYVVSIVMIVFAVTVKMQNLALLNAPLGFDKENLLVLNLDDSQRASVVNRLASIPDVVSTAAYNGSFGEYECDGISTVIVDGDTLKAKFYFVTPEFLDVMHIPLIKGRQLKEGDLGVFMSDSISNVVINRKAAERYNAVVDSIMPSTGGRGYRVVGITENFISKSAADVVEPVGFSLNNYYYTLMIRVNGNNLTQTINDINAAVREIIPVQPPTVKFYDDVIAKLYDKERDLATLITIFSILAIIIALVGVFGQVVFETQYRRKEIGLRKINGATVGKILVMFNSKFVLLIAVCFVIAAPLAWYGVSEWLKVFAIKTSVEWWFYAIALLIVTAITVLTVTIQSWLSATENPVKSLKAE